MDSLTFSQGNLKNKLGPLPSSFKSEKSMEWSCFCQAIIVINNAWAFVISIVPPLPFDQNPEQYFSSSCSFSASWRAQWEMTSSSYPASSGADLDLTWAPQAIQKNHAPCWGQPRVSISQWMLLLTGFSLQANASGNGPDRRIDGIFSKWQDISIGQGREGNVLCLYRRKGSQTNKCHPGLLSLGLLRRANARFFPWRTGKTGWCGPSSLDFPRQRSKELVPPHARRKDRVNHGQIYLEILGFY